MVSLAENQSRITRCIAESCRRSRRDPKEINLIWVSKTHPREKILEALHLGAYYLGESRVQETLSKFPLPPNSPPHSLHFIGHLQSNKVKKILPLVHCIHSVDSLPLLLRLENTCHQLGLHRQVFLQVNVSRELEKQGFAPDEFLEILSQIPRSFLNLEIIGLMCIGPNCEEEGPKRAAFKTLSSLLKEARQKFQDRESLRNMDRLSMGMSRDFELAIEEGSHYIRIGTDLFGER